MNFSPIISELSLNVFTFPNRTFEARQNGAFRSLKRALLFEISAFENPYGYRGNMFANMGFVNNSKSKKLFNNRSTGVD